LKQHFNSSILKYIFIVIALFLSASFFFNSCKKNNFLTSSNAGLNLSTDSLKYDTVFTTTGSITKSFKIINTNDQKLLLNKVKLMGGASSAYKININGQATTESNNIELAANDSIYVFVTVTINPTAANLPFIVSDSILINYNGNNKFVQLQAYGQNAIFIDNGITISNTTFTNTKPYVIVGGFQVSSGTTLTINAGAKIYCHANAPILVDGTIICNGTKALPIIFTGDRLDEPYVNFPASWPGIYCRASSTNNVFVFTQIKNAYQALNAILPSTNANPKITIKQSIIDNAFDAGIFSNNSSITAENTIISNCSKNINIVYGGNYNITHCTIAGYSNNYVQHKNASVSISDANDNNQTNTLNAVIKNTIIYGDAGNVQNEIQVNKVGSSFNVSLINCLYKNATDPANVTISQSIKNIDPSFDSINNVNRFYDFRTTKNAQAPGVNKGVATSLLKDLDDNNRNVGLPDIGAYEKP
jgi:hypothetical protein